MVVLNIAIIGSDDLAKSIAKAADQRDVHTYVHKEAGDDGPRILSLIRPAKYPERLPPFLNALSTARVMSCASSNVSSVTSSHLGDGGRIFSAFAIGPQETQLSTISFFSTA